MRLLSTAAADRPDCRREAAMTVRHLMVNAREILAASGCFYLFSVSSCIFLQSPASFLGQRKCVQNFYRSVHYPRCCSCCARAMLRKKCVCIRCCISVTSWRALVVLVGQGSALYLFFVFVMKLKAASALELLVKDGACDSTL